MWVAHCASLQQRTPVIHPPIISAQLRWGVPAPILINVPGVGQTPLAHDGTWQSEPQQTGSLPYVSTSQPISQPGGSAGHGKRRAEDIAVANDPLAPVAHWLALRRSTSSAALLCPL